MLMVPTPWTKTRYFPRLDLNPGCGVEAVGLRGIRRSEVRRTRRASNIAALLAVTAPGFWFGAKIASCRQPVDEVRRLS